MTIEQKETVLEIKDLTIEFPFRDSVSRAVNGVSLTVREGESIGIVGESGCGKTITCYSSIGLLPPVARLVKGEVLVTKSDGSVIDVAQEPDDSENIRNIRGRDISLIFQEPMAALSPLYTMSAQIVEAIRAHNKIKKEEAHQQAVELFRQVGIPNPEERINEYPFQFSGGMMQRAMIAMALSCKPRLLIADEPTTALDVTTQAQVLLLIRRMQLELGISLILVTHNLGLVAHMTERVYVMYLGKIVEEATSLDIFDRPKHPYTQGLIGSIPRVFDPKDKLESIPGAVPSGLRLPTGCSFHPRCSHFIKGKCDVEEPEMIQVGPEHRVSCFLYED